MSSFKREHRYFVIKLSDVEKLQLGAREIVEANMESADFYMSEHGAQNRQCLVIESDWPEYEVVWKMIENRTNGAKP